MQAIATTQFGPPDFFNVLDLPEPIPGPGQLRIRCRAASFNPADYKRRRGNFGGQLPMILGLDVAGVVDAIGPETSGFAVGDEVWCFLAQPQGGIGGYAQAVVTPVEFVAPKPKSMTFEHAAALPVGALTAYECITHHAEARPGETALVAGASGGVGSFLVQMLKHYGASKVLATAGSESSSAYLQSLGVPAGNILDYVKLTPDGLLAGVRELTGGRGVDMAFDLYGGAMKPLCTGAIAPFGRVVTIVEEPSDFSFNVFAPTPDNLFFKSASLHFEFLMTRALLAPRAAWSVYARMMRQLNALVEGGTVKLPKIEVLGPLSVDTVRRAHQRLEAGHIHGKLVMRID